MIDDLLERAEKFVKKRLKDRRKNRSSASGYSGRYGYGTGSGRGRDDNRGSQEMVRGVLARLSGRPDCRGRGIHGAFSDGHDLDRRWRNDLPHRSVRSKRRRKGFDLD